MDNITLGAILLLSGGLLALYGHSLFIDTNSWLSPELASGVINSGLIIMCIGIGLLLGRFLHFGTSQPSVTAVKS